MWCLLWFAALVAAEWVVLRFHYEDWRANSPRITWLLNYGTMFAIGVGFLLLTKRMLSNPIHRRGLALVLRRGGMALVLIVGALVCLFNLLAVLLTSKAALLELRDGVDTERQEMARLRGSETDLVAYYDASHEGVLVDAVLDVVVQHHAVPWQHKLLRMDGRYVTPKLERAASGAKLVLFDRWDQHVVQVIDLDWN
jgi:hypothetical protein